MRVRNSVCLLIGLALAACGGDAFDNDGSGGSGASGGSGGSGGGAGSGGGGTGGAGGALFLEGSHELHFASVTPASTWGLSSPSQGSTARLDIRAKTPGYEAVFTGRRNDPALYSVELNPTNVTLRGEGGFARETISDRWIEIVLEIGSDGRLGSMTAAGTSTVSMGDVLADEPVTATGTVTADTLAPEFSQIDETTPFLPWDAIRLRAAEPVPSEAVLERARVGVADGLTASVNWNTGSLAPETLWAGVTLITGYFTDWSAVAASPWQPAILGGVVDPAGNSSSDFVSAVFATLPIGEPSASHDFDSDAVNAGTWGSAVFLGGLAADPRCETGGCAMIEFENQYCSPQPNGIAARLLGTDAAVRYRVIVHDEMASDGRPGYVPTPFRVEIALPGQPAAMTYPTVESVELQPYTDPVRGLAGRWATAWRTFTASTGADVDVATELGVAIHAGASSGCGGGGPMPPPVLTTVLIDRLDAS